MKTKIELQRALFPRGLVVDRALELQPLKTTTTQFDHCDCGREPDAIVSPAPNPSLAAGLSLPIPGAGHLYAGRRDAGLAIFAAAVLGYIVSLPLGGLATVLGSVAAYSAARHRMAPARPIVSQAVERR